jgi:hypothetical protein
MRGAFVSHNFPVADIPALPVPPDHGFALGRNNLTSPGPAFAGS